MAPSRPLGVPRCARNSNARASMSHTGSASPGQDTQFYGFVKNKKRTNTVTTMGPHLPSESQAVYSSTT